MSICPPNPDVIGVARHLSSHIRPVLVWPNSKLSQQCEIVTEFDDELGQLLMDMFFTADSNNGIGLAAPQVGVLKNVIVLSMPHNRRLQNLESPTATPEYSETFKEHTALINPEIIESGGADFKMTEGCLSVPGYFEERHRPYTVTVRYQDARGRERVDTFTHMKAFVVQHEMDHLTGKVFVDELSSLKKDRVKKKITKTIKNS